MRTHSPSFDIEGAIREATGKFGGVLERPRPLPFGRCRGMPGLFKPDTDVGNQQTLL